MMLERLEGEVGSEALFASLCAWLGHSTTHMTMRYAHLAPNSGSELISRLESPRRGNDVAKRQG